jgi:glycerol-3-phosphate acyltransferase PlsY
MHISIVYILIFLSSYAFGSIPFSWIITKFKTGEDLRKVGSGNVGGRNVYRVTKSKFWAFLAGILDVSRSLIAVTVPYFLSKKLYFDSIDTPITMFIWNDVHLLTGFALTIAGIGGILGHNWSIYLLSHAGRGITVVIGSMVFANPILLLFWIVLWPFVITIVGYSAIAYIVVTLLVGIIALFIPPALLMPWAPHNLGLALLLFGIAIIMVTRQKDNFRKIRIGEAKKMNILKALRGKGKLSEEALK